MNDVPEHKERYEEFIRLERAIEANKENLQKLKKSANFTSDVENIYQNVVKTQEQLLIKCFEE